MTGRSVVFPAAVALSLALAACKPAGEAAAPAQPAADAAPRAPAATTPAPANVPAKAVDAALLASGFRAVGQEPGWTAEVTTGDAQALHAVVDYGERKFDIASVARQPDGWSGKTADGTAVVLKVERRACQDTMSGESFEATAMLVVGDRDYPGCGNFKPR